MSVLVTGGAGFIGSNLVRELLARGQHVRVLDNFSTGKRDNLHGLSGKLEVIEDDIRDKQACRAACDGVEAVFHQAALGSVPRSVEDPLTTHAVNVDGTLNLLLAVREKNLRRFVYASSSSVYGEAVHSVKSESDSTHPVSPYAASKLAAEAYVLAFGRVFDFEAVALRYFNVFGPRQDPESRYAAVVPRFVTSLLGARRPVIFGDGEQTRDFTYVDNVVSANLLALECAPAACGRAYNVGCGSSTSVNDLFCMIREQIGGGAASLEPANESPRPGDVRASLASTEAIREALGYEPAVSVKRGLELAVEWYRSQTTGTTPADENTS